MRMYDYLVYYTFSAEGYLTASTGTIQVSRKKKLNTFEEVNKLTEFVTECITKKVPGAKNVAINNFILLGRNKH